MNLFRNITVFRGEYELKIKHIWFTPTVYFTMFFTLVWTCIVFSMFPLDIFKMENETNAQVGFTVGAAISFFLIYKVLAGFLNRTIIIVTNGKMSVRHVPLPWWGSKEILLKSIDQFYVDEETYEGNVSYHLKAIFKDGTEEKMMRPFEIKDDAEKVEIELNFYLVRNL